MSRTYKTARPMKTLQTRIDKDCSAMLKALSLPEILQEIFCHLDIQSKSRAAQVSWTWYNITQQRHLWKDMTVGYSYDESVPSIYKIAPLKDMTVECSHDEIVPYIYWISSKDYWDNNFYWYNNYWREYPQITKLAIHGHPTDKAIYRIVQQFKTLASLNLNWWLSNPRNYKISDTGLTLIVGRLKFLRHLDLCNCESITDIGISTLCSWNGMGSDGNVPLLHSLSLSSNNNVTNNALKFLSIGQPDLQRLNLTLCGGISNSGLKFLVQLVNLHVLNLIGCNGISDAGMIHLARMANLTNLGLTDNSITSAGLKLLASGVSLLTNLSLNRCDVDDTCGPMLASMSRLVKLDLNRTEIGDKVLQCLADVAGTSTIDSLNLECCGNITDEAGRHLARMLKLREVNLARSSIGDAGLSHLADAVNSKIEILSLVSGQYISDTGLNHLARLSLFRKLNVCHCDFYIKWGLSNPRITVVPITTLKVMCIRCYP